MASSNYTSNLHLNAWADGDRPKRADFVADNTIIDTQLGGHINNSAIHVSAEEKTKLSEPFVTVVYAGSGESERTLTLGFQPKFAMVFKRNSPPTAYESGVTVVYSGCGAYGQGGTSGVSLSATGVTVHETAASNGVRVSLNQSGGQYTLIAFRS